MGCDTKTLRSMPYDSQHLVYYDFYFVSILKMNDFYPMFWCEPPYVFMIIKPSHLFMKKRI